MELRPMILAKIEAKKRIDGVDDPNKLSLNEAFDVIQEYEKKNNRPKLLSWETLRNYYHGRGYNSNTEKRIAEGLGLC
jgi:hypothetical protein